MRKQQRRQQQLLLLHRQQELHRQGDAKVAERLARMARFATMRRTARMAGFIGGLGSAALTVRAAYNLGSPLLVTILVAGWVMAPFVLFVMVDRASRHWATLTRSTLYASMLLVALGSLAIYLRFVFGPTRAKPAFAFVAVPPASVILAGSAIVIAALVSRGMSHEA